MCSDGLFYKEVFTPERLSASEVHDLFHAKIDSLFQECETVAENAPHGRTVHDLDDFLIIAGRKFRLNQVES